MTPTLPDWSQLQLVMPEIWLVIAMCAVLMAPLARGRKPIVPTVIALVGTILATVSAAMSIGQVGDTGTALFHGTLAIDPFSQFFKVLLGVFTTLVLIQWWVIGRDRTDEGDVPDFQCLLLGAAFGMSLMASANNLLTILVAIEAASLPSFALAGFFKRQTRGTEAALKYVVFGAAASAINVYGMSLIYGATGSLALPEIAAAATSGVSPLLAVGMVGLLIGVAFKLSAVPVHFWCPDVFEGAPFEVTTFLSVASKGAAIALLLRITQSFGLAGDFPALAAGLAIIGGVTATWGNLVALQQTHVRRLLAYSSIAHAGYMIMAVSLLAVAGPEARQAISAAILFYLLVYLFMNLGAFTVAAVIADREGTENLESYAGLLKRSPALSIGLGLCLLSLFGMPGLGGFSAKLLAMGAMVNVGTVGLVLVVVLLLNTLISLYYYLRPIYFMVLVEDQQDRPAFVPAAGALALLVVCVAALFWTGLLPGSASDLTSDHGATLDATHIEAPVETPVAEATTPLISTE
ncbi:MAG: NADH-quinone oxidoreductase subunit N [Phycisphaeraceae bacterium]|nr:NADH-quinone oxidoreductase subunit N [Phycisphaeraceae bacterium]